MVAVCPCVPAVNAPPPVGTHRDEARLLEEVNKWIAANLKNGKLDAIYKEYHGNGLPDVILNQ